MYFHSKIKFLILSLFAFSILFSSCNSNELTEKENKINELKEKIKNDSIMLIKVNTTLNNIDNTIDSLGLMHGELSESKNISTKDAIEKIKLISNVLEEKKQTITDLETSLDKIKSSLPVGFIKENKKQLELQLEYYNQLKNELETVKKEKVNLAEIIKEKDKQIISKDNAIIQLQKEKKEQTTILKELNTKIIVAENEYEEAKISTGKNYYSLSEDIRLLADKTSGIMAKRKKKNLIMLSYEYYKKSYQMGYNKAKVKISLMETEKKYNKYLEN